MDTTNKAIVCLVEETNPIPGADFIIQARVKGLSVIVHHTTKVGDIGVLFDDNLQLSHEFCFENNLYYTPELNKDTTKKGYFGKNRKVRAQSFKKVKSEGLFVPLSYFDFCFPSKQGFSPSVGFEFDRIGEIPICNKYYTPQTLRAMSNKERFNKPTQIRFQAFPEHVSTQHFLKEVNKIPIGSILYVTEKLHGTSGRFGNVYTEIELPNPWYKKIFGIKPKIEKGYKYLNGTRRTILGISDKPYYGSEKFRDKVIESLKGKLHKGEVIYYEIVGFTDNGHPIMPRHDVTQLKDKELSKGLPKLMTYSYGCCPEGIFGKQQEIYVYRIIKTDEDGHFVEYSWPQVLRRCKELGINVVPNALNVHYLGEGIGINNTKEVNSIVEEEGKGTSILDKTHIKEGVCIRVETPDGYIYTLKNKSYLFKVLEGIMKEDENYVEVEDLV